MITLYTGTPGSGKSYHVIKVILKNLKLGKLVISNFPIKFSQTEIDKGYEKRFFYVSQVEITVPFLIKFAKEENMIEKKKESQCMCIIDEAGGKFNSRDFNSKDRLHWIDFFSQHRKLGYDFILVAQNDRMIDRQIRTCVETEKKHRKLNNYGIFAILPFTAFVCIEYWYTAKERVSSEFFRYKKRYGNRYDSMKLFEGFRLDI